MTSYEFVGEDISNLWGVVGVGDSDDGTISVQAHSWDGIAQLELTAEQARVLIRIIGAHLPGGEMMNSDASYVSVGVAYYEVGVRHGRNGGTRVLVSEGDISARVDLTAEQSKKLIHLFEAHLPSTDQNDRF